VKNQLGLFGPTTEVEPHVTDEDRAIAARVPARIRFGTSRWSFPGWSGIVYAGSPSEATLARSGLAAYARHPLFRTVGLDRSHYAPLRDEDLLSYAAQLEGTEEKGFEVVSKVWNEITTSSSPHFLDASVFLSEILPPYERTFTKWAGPFVFQLTPMPRGVMDEHQLAHKVDTFLERLPKTFRYAFELRNAELLGRRWVDTLRAHGAAHVFNYWTAMPSLREQLAAGTHHSSFMVVRLMLPPFTRYEAKKEEYKPFNRLVAPQETMREDVDFILRAAEEADCDDAFVIVNNKAEGSSPLTVKELAKRAGERADQSSTTK
jgi:uncharacterized protein YecE (DUF72 family)